MFELGEISKSIYRDSAKGLIRLWSVAVILFAINGAIIAIFSIFGINFDIGFFSLVAALVTSYYFYGFVLFSVAFLVAGLFFGVFIFPQTNESSEENADTVEESEIDDFD